MKRFLSLNELRAPIIAAPMFLVSGPDLVIKSCQAGIVGSFPALNARTSNDLRQWLIRIETELSESSERTAPFAVNLIVHKSNKRLEQDLETCIAHKVPIIITSLGAVPEIVEKIHNYGGLVFHDVTNIRHAKKAISAQVDGLIAVTAGAGGHAGQLHPFAFLEELREIFTGYIALAGSISNGRHVQAAQILGADFAYIGTKFIASTESFAHINYKKMLIESQAADIIYTSKISGVCANFIRRSITDLGIDLEKIDGPDVINFGDELVLEDEHSEKIENALLPRPWKDIWSAGHGVGNVRKIQSVAEIIQEIIQEYQLLRK